MANTICSVVVIVQRTGHLFYTTHCVLNAYLVSWFWSPSIRVNYIEAISSLCGKNWMYGEEEEAALALLTLKTRW